MGKIIGIAGVAGSGKDTVAGMIKERVGHAGFHQVRFADPIKDAVLAIFNRPPPYRVYYDQVFGSSELREKQIGNLVTNDGKPFTIRYALQTMGTELGRVYWNKDIWAKIGIGTAQAIARLDRVVIITDCRFDNEFELLREAGGELWHLERPGAGLTGDWPRWKWVKRVPAEKRASWMLTSHPSERDLQGPRLRELRTHHLMNDAGLDTLSAAVGRLLTA